MTPRDPGHAARPQLTSAQRRAVAGADTETGEIRAATATLRALVALGLAAPYGRLGAHYLTALGRAVRRGLDQPVVTSLAQDDRDARGFSPATGDCPAETGDERVRTTVQAWRSLLDIRTLTNGDGTAPAGWERARPVHAVALALEAAGAPPSAVDPAGRRTHSGFRVADADGEPGTVRVEWRQAAGAGGGDPREGLRNCAALLAARGWDPERYADSRRRPYLLVTPHHPAGDTSPAGA